MILRPSVTTPAYGRYEVSKTYLCSKLLDAVQYLWHISSFKQVNRLEQPCLWHTIALAEIEKQLNVFHLRTCKPTSVYATSEIHKCIEIIKKLHLRLCDRARTKFEHLKLQQYHTNT